MYQYITGKLAISVNDWKEAGLTYNQFRMDSQRGYLEIVRRGINGETMIDVRSIKRRARREKIEAMYGTIDEMDSKALVNAIEPNADASEWFREYTYTDESGNERRLPLETQRQYATEASILDMLCRVYDQQRAARAAYGTKKSKKEFWNEAVNRVKKLSGLPETFNRLPQNPRSLERKFDRYRSCGFQTLVTGMYGKRTAGKLTEDAKYWLIARYATPIEKLTIQQLFVAYNTEVQKRNAAIADPAERWKPLESSQTIYTFLNRPEIKQLWFGMRYGELKSKEKYTRQHKTVLPEQRDALWYGDGTKLNYYYRDEKGNIRTCNVYEVMDVYSECLLGYHISDSEDFEAQYFAYRMALQFSGHRPNEIRYDNQGGHKKLAAGRFFGKLANLNIPTMPYNGKSKTVESAFGRLQSQFLHKEWYFTGQNITAKKKESRENYEFIMANKANLPTLDEIKRKYAQRRKEWNDAEHFDTGIPHIEMYRRSVNKKTKAVDIIDMIDMFGVIDPVANTYTAQGLVKTVKRKEYRWEVLTAAGNPDYGFLRNNVDRKFHVGYDLNDMSLVALYSKDAKGYRFEALAQKYIEIHRAKQDQDDFDYAFIKAAELANKNMREEMTEDIESIMEYYGMHPAQHGLNMPKPRGISWKAADVGSYTKQVSELVTADLEDRM